MGFDGDGFSTFMNTEKESEKFHKGIFEGIKVGLKTHDPRKVRKVLNATDYKLSEWHDYYKNDEHYHDVPALLTYGTTTAIEAGAALYAGEQIVQYAAENIPELANEYLVP